MRYAFLSRLRRPALPGLPVMLPLPATAAARPVDAPPSVASEEEQKREIAGLEQMLGWPGGMMGMEGSGMAVRKDG
ncbi:MAG: hypothetical protein AB1941_29725 [Gemmatimonadota bacterium]